MPSTNYVTPRGGREGLVLRNQCVGNREGDGVSAQRNVTLLNYSLSGYAAIFWLRLGTLNKGEGVFS